MIYAFKSEIGFALVELIELAIFGRGERVGSKLPAPYMPFPRREP